MAFAAIGNLHAMAGGRAPIYPDGNTLFVKYQDDVLHCIRGTEKIMNLYLDYAGKKRASINYSLWLPSGVEIDTSTWSVENSDTRVTLSDDSDDGISSQCYIAIADNNRNRDQEFWVKNTIVTNQSPVPETISNSIRVLCVRRVG